MSHFKRFICFSWAQFYVSCILSVCFNWRMYYIFHYAGTIASWSHWRFQSSLLLCISIGWAWSYSSMRDPYFNKGLMSFEVAFISFNTCSSMCIFVAVRCIQRTFETSSSLAHLVVRQVWEKLYGSLACTWRIPTWSQVSNTTNLDFTSHFPIMIPMKLLFSQHTFFFNKKLNFSFQLIYQLEQTLPHQWSSPRWCCCSLALIFEFHLLFVLVFLAR